MPVRSFVYSPIDKPVVAVGVGATAVLGASSLSKVVHASTFMKTVPASLKLMITQSQKVFAMVLSKTFGSSNLVHAFTGSGVKTSAMKATVSVEKIRATCTGLIMCGGGIECAVESFPVAPSIASLGRGIQNLRQAAKEYVYDCQYFQWSELQQKHALICTDTMRQLI